MVSAMWEETGEETGRWGVGSRWGLGRSRRVGREGDAAAAGRSGGEGSMRRAGEKERRLRKLFMIAAMVHLVGCVAAQEPEMPGTQQQQQGIEQVVSKSGRSKNVYVRTHIPPNTHLELDRSNEWVLPLSEEHIRRKDASGHHLDVRCGADFTLSRIALFDHSPKAQQFTQWNDTRFPQTHFLGEASDVFEREVLDPTAEADAAAKAGDRARSFAALAEVPDGVSICTAMLRCVEAPMCHGLLFVKDGKRVLLAHENPGPRWNWASYTAAAIAPLRASFWRKSGEAAGNADHKGLQYVRDLQAYHSSRMLDPQVLRWKKRIRRVGAGNHGKYFGLAAPKLGGAGGVDTIDRAAAQLQGAHSHGSLAHYVRRHRTPISKLDKGGVEIGTALARKTAFVNGRGRPAQARAAGQRRLLSFGDALLPPVSLTEPPGEREATPPPAELPPQPPAQDVPAQTMADQGKSQRQRDEQGQRQKEQRLQQQMRHQYEREQQRRNAARTRADLLAANEPDPANVSAVFLRSMDLTTDPLPPLTLKSLLESWPLFFGLQVPAPMANALKTFLEDSKSAADKGPQTCPLDLTKSKAGYRSRGDKRDDGRVALSPAVVAACLHTFATRHNGDASWSFPQFYFGRSSVVSSFTSVPSRLRETLITSLETILQQSVLPDTIYFNMPAVNMRTGNQYRMSQSYGRRLERVVRENAPEWWWKPVSGEPLVEMRTWPAEPAQQEKEAARLERERQERVSVAARDGQLAAHPPRIVVLGLALDNGPASKLIPTVQQLGHAHPDQLILVHDDDTFYPHRLLETLYAWSMRFQRAAVGYRGFRVNPNTVQPGAPTTNFRRYYAFNMQAPALVHVLTACCGYMVTPSHVSSELWNLPSRCIGCSYMDDPAIAGVEAKQEVPRFVVPGPTGCEHMAVVTTLSSQLLDVRKVTKDKNVFVGEGSTMFADGAAAPESGGMAANSPTTVDVADDDPVDDGGSADQYAEEDAVDEAEHGGMDETQPTSSTDVSTPGVGADAKAKFPKLAAIKSKLERSGFGGNRGLSRVHANMGVLRFFLQHWEPLSYYRPRYSSTERFVIPPAPSDLNFKAGNIARAVEKRLKVGWGGAVPGKSQPEHR